MVFKSDHANVETNML